ncbi:hypothetical protein INT43_004607 [Umbelopsis isabellina]|uniref:DUF8032 domain-containing protein n=1 Tax=Mortierella isabellina TaxID=91625 RepID=A0A8H7PG48_MORIS|nr:hypothetical protein INT43_004607 [Umbelopsis isabellina]
MTSNLAITPAEVLEQSHQPDLFSTKMDQNVLLDDHTMSMQPLLPQDESTWMMMMDLNTSPIRHLSLDLGRPNQMDMPIDMPRRYTMPADLSTMFNPANIAAAAASASLPTSSIEAMAVPVPSYDPHMYISALSSPHMIDSSAQSSLESSMPPSLQSSLPSSKATSLNNSPKFNPSPSKQSGRRKSVHSSVAAAVALTAHEPTTSFIDGIEHLTFMYSHDRHVKQYTIRTDIDTVDLNDIDDDFRQASAVYPRANVPMDQYAGNRWEYETSCNQLGWKLAFKNTDILFGRRGLIQRAVDSYRNRHRDLRSRRVTRQEKIANGTLRKRQAKKRKQRILSSSDKSVSPPQTRTRTSRPRKCSETLTIEHPTKGSHHRICFMIDDIPACESAKERYKLYDHLDDSQTAQYREWCNEISWRLAVKNTCLANDQALLQCAVNECVRRKSPAELQDLTQTSPILTEHSKPLFDKDNCLLLDRFQPPPFAVQQQS